MADVEGGTGTVNQRVLEHTLKESQVGIRMMARDHTNTHVFNFGTDPQGNKHVFVMAVVPETRLGDFVRAIGGTLLKDSAPLSEEVSA